MPERMTKREKYLERIHLLRTLANYGPLHASDLADRANSECDGDVFDALPDISRRGIGQKLQAMEGEGLIAGSFLGVGLPKHWELVEGGRRALAIFENEEPYQAAVVSPDYRQAALELHAEIRGGLLWIEQGAEPSVALHHMKTVADKWRPLLEAA